LYKNENSENNYLRINLIGKSENRDAIGTIIKYESAHIKGIYEHNTSRGYLSSVDARIVLGLGQDTLVNIFITWPDGSYSELKNQKLNQSIQIDQSVVPIFDKNPLETKEFPIFHPSENLPNIITEDKDYIDYNTEPLLLHKLSQYGPGVAVGDINGDGLDDFYVTGSYTKQGHLFVQNKKGQFVESQQKLPVNSICEEQGALFFDVDNDGDQDLYIASGANQFENTHELYEDILLINENGIFTNISDQLELPSGSSSCVRASDFDRDGDLDLFVAGRVDPGQYPMPVNSYLLINNSSPGMIDLKIANSELAPELNKIGMVCDALWTDYDSDGWQDLILAGEWMPITILKNENGHLKNKTVESGIKEYIGWWNSIASADFDHDGDLDYVVSNLGKNSTLRTSMNRPIELYAKDFDDNGSIDAIPFVYYKNLNNQEQLYPFHGRNDLAKEVNRTNKRFTSYQSLGVAPIDSILSDSDRKDAYILKATTFATTYLKNKGNGKFELIDMPIESQTSPIFGILAEDFNEDGHTDILMVGNDYGAQPILGRMDGFNGLMLKGKGDGTFEPLSIRESGFYVPGDAKSIVQIFNQKKRSFLASQNNDRLLGFDIASDAAIFNPESDDVLVDFLDTNNQTILKKELYYGNGFLSQSSRKIPIPKNTKSIKVTKYNQETRVLDRQEI
jgi:hypothetical protein